MKTVGILSSGGDAPGMNACLYYLVKMLEEKKVKCIGFEGGYQGMMENRTIQLSSAMFLPFIDKGGSLIQAGRSSEFTTPKGRQQAADNLLKKNKCERLIVLGGNGTIGGLRDMIPYGVRSIGIPATIDNDLFYSEYTLGFDSASNENMHLTDSVKRACFAQGKIPIVEIMGRDCSKLALRTAIGVAADVLIACEMGTTADQVVSKVKTLVKNGQKNITIVSIEKYMNLDALAVRIEKETGRGCKVCVNGYAQRGCDATAADRMLGYKFAAEAVCNLDNPLPQLAVGIKNKKTFVMPVVEALATQDNFNEVLYSKIYK